MIYNSWVINFNLDVRPEPLAPFYDEDDLFMFGGDECTSNLEPRKNENNF